MEKIIRYFCIITIIGFLFFKSFEKEEINGKLINTINHKHQVIDSLYNHIDSLYKIIDTLILESEIWDHNITYNKTHLLSAIIHVESSGRDSAYHKGEDAVGCLQIRRCMVDDVNRILLRQKSDIHFIYDDRWLRDKSIEMFEIYCKHYGLTTAEEIARCWNGGPRGINNPSTREYWEKVKNQINS